MAIGLTLFLVVDVTLAVGASSSLRERFWRYPNDNPNALRVEVSARQWSWTFRTAGPDGRFATPTTSCTLNELHVPTGRPIYFKVRSKDVVHSLYLPNFRTKIDAIPGSTTAAVGPGAGARPLRDRLRAALRRQPLQDGRLADRRRLTPNTQLAGARRERQPAAYETRDDRRRQGWDEGWDWETACDRRGDHRRRRRRRRRDLQPIHAAPTGFLRRAVFSVDHKVIGRQFLCPGARRSWPSGASMAMLIRWQLASPGRPVPIVGRLLFGESGGVDLARRRTRRCSRCTARS